MRYKFLLGSICMLTKVRFEGYRLASTWQDIESIQPKKTAYIVLEANTRRRVLHHAQVNAKLSCIQASIVISIGE